MALKQKQIAPARGITATVDSQVIPLGEKGKIFSVTLSNTAGGSVTAALLQNGDSGGSNLARYYTLDTAGHSITSTFSQGLAFDNGVYADFSGAARVMSIAYVLENDYA